MRFGMRTHAFIVPGLTCNLPTGPDDARAFRHMPCSFIKYPYLAYLPLTTSIKYSYSIWPFH